MSPTLAGRGGGLFANAVRVLESADPAEKVRLTRAAAKAWADAPQLGEHVPAPASPARPPLPPIVRDGRLPTARELNVSTNVHLLHMLAHVELNAIDLSLDTLARFACHPSRSSDFAADFLSIAVDEARHFALLDARLRALGSFYGALPAHDLVWTSADRSTKCCRMRLALGQLVQEARGLDAGPRLAARLVGTGDVESARIVETIADEELRHVQLGVEWFVRECGREGREPVEEFHAIALEHANPGAFAPPFDEKRRRQAGLEPEWYLPVAKLMKQHVEKERKLQKEKQVAEVNGSMSDR